MDCEGISPLTKYQMQVLCLVVKGLTNKEIAHSLGIKERTVEYHLGKIFQRLNVTSRTAAAIKAEKMGFFVD